MAYEDPNGVVVPDPTFGEQFSASAAAAGNRAYNAATSVSGSLANLLDPSKARLALSGLSSSARSVTGGVNWQGGTGIGQCGPGYSEPEDWRVRVSVAPGSGALYDLEGMTFLNPIKSTNGVVFPITPQIQMTYTAKYSSASLTHSNYAMHFYEGSEIGSIQINGEFPVQNIEEGQYLLAAIYFFRGATKMYWGEDEYAGTPPPMVYLTGYGAHYFPNVPCVITQFMHTMPEDRDFIEVPAPGQTNGPITRLPTQSTLQLQLQPLYSRKALAKFDLDNFANGEMITGNGFRGGFI